MIDRALPTISGSGGKMIAEGQAARLDQMALVLAHDLHHWSAHWPNDPLAAEARTDAVRRITAWREEAKRRRMAIAAFDERDVRHEYDVPEQLRGVRR